MEINWDDAPKWADKVCLAGKSGELAWSNNEQYEYILPGSGGPYVFNDSQYFCYSKNELKLVERRPDAWQEGEERMTNIDGHYDAVNHPEHYQSEDGIECIDAIRASLGLDGFVAYCRGNAIKYSWRSGKKSEHAEDLRKAAWYLDRAAQELEKSK